MLVSCMHRIMLKFLFELDSYVIFLVFLKTVIP